MHALDSGDEVRAALQRWLDAFNAHDLDTLMTLYDVEATYANADAPLRRGIPAIRASFETAFARGRGQLAFREETFVSNGNLALIAGRYLVSTIEVDGRSTPASTGRVALLYRRAPDDRWLLAYDMDNAPPDVDPADFE